jgi:hypothetical protein
MKKCLLLLIALLFLSISSSVFAKREVTRQLGGACGEDANILATCASGLHCDGGSCQMNSFLSSATVGCREAMKKMGVDEKYVAVHDGFCYIDSSCHGLYQQVMRATPATEAVLGHDNRVDPNKLANLPEDQRHAFETAAETCRQCGKCVIGRQFLGRGGY